MLINIRYLSWNINIRINYLVTFVLKISNCSGFIISKACTSILFATIFIIAWNILVSLYIMNSYFNWTLLWNWSWYIWFLSQSNNNCTILTIWSNCFTSYRTCICIYISCSVIFTNIWNVVTIVINCIDCIEVMTVCIPSNLTCTSDLAVFNSY